jgi:muconolactone delta-isomerase
MRFLVVTESNTPIPLEAVLPLYEATKAWKARYAAAGKLEQIWGFAGGKGGCAISNVDSLEELNQIAAEYPFQPFSRMDIYGLVDFDKSVESATKAFGAMLSGMPKR